MDYPYIYFKAAKPELGQPWRVELRSASMTVNLSEITSKDWIVNGCVFVAGMIDEQHVSGLFLVNEGRGIFLRHEPSYKLHLLRDLAYPLARAYGTV